VLHTKKLSDSSDSFFVCNKYFVRALVSELQIEQYAHKLLFGMYPGLLILYFPVFKDH